MLKSVNSSKYVLLLTGNLYHFYLFMSEMNPFIHLGISSFEKKENLTKLPYPPREINLSFISIEKENHKAFRNGRNIKYQLFELGKNNFDQIWGVPLFWS